jgi:hypothetical protein
VRPTGPEEQAERYETNLVVGVTKFCQIIFTWIQMTTPLLVIRNLEERGSDIVSIKVNSKAKPQNIGSQDKQ